MGKKNKFCDTVLWVLRTNEIDQKRFTHGNEPLMNFKIDLFQMPNHIFDELFASEEEDSYNWFRVDPENQIDVEAFGKVGDDIDL